MRLNYVVHLKTWIVEHNASSKSLEIVVNMGVGEAAQQSKLIDGALADLELITGQKPIVTKQKLYFKFSSS